MLSVFCQAAAKRGGECLIPHNADVMHLRVQEAQVRAEQAECVWEIK